MFNFMRPGQLVPVPEIEGIPQAANTVRLAVRFPCGCTQTVDIRLEELDGRSALSTEQFLGEKTSYILEKLVNISEKHHGGNDPIPGER